MDTEPLVFVGIDWASTEHQVCLTGTGDPVQRATAVSAGRIGFILWAALVTPGLFGWLTSA